MKALTLHQPWASFVSMGLKTIETRSWPTTHRGALAIHAAKSIPRYAVDYFSGLDETTKKILFLASLDKLGSYPTGCVVAVVNVLECVRMTAENIEQIDLFERDLGDYRPDRYMWIFGGIETYKPPIPAKGRQGLWRWEPEGARYDHAEVVGGD